MSEKSDETLDSIGTANVRVLQRRSGYRFTLDAVLLAAFAATEGRDAGGPLLELGAGSGVVSFLLACQFGLGPVDALELQPEVHARLVRAVALNACEQRVRPLLGDLREARSLFPPGAYAHVVSNPPFRPAHAGVRSPDEERAVSKAELACDAPSVVAMAQFRSFLWNRVRPAMGPSRIFLTVMPLSLATWRRMSLK